MTYYISLKKKDKYSQENNNNKFLQEFNMIFNKIPHIYSEIFLKIFSTNYRYFTMFTKNNNFLNFTKVLERIFYNYQNKYTYEFFYNNIKDDLETLLSLQIEEEKIINITKNISSLLSSNIEITFLLDLIDNKIKNNYFENKYLKNFKDEDKICIYQIAESYLIGKVLIKIIKILNIYNNQKNTYIYNKISKSVDKFRTIELIMDHALDIYDSKYINIVPPDEFKILIYLLSLSKNGEDIENKFNYDIDKIFLSLGYSTSIKKIINCQRGNDYLEILNSKYYKEIVTLLSYRDNPYIYENINEVINILFQKYHDDYTFIINKENILKKIFYSYIKNIDLYNKILICTQYKLWRYEWDSIKEKYESNYLDNSISNDNYF